jgi:hypothetical protein
MSFFSRGNMRSNKGGRGKRPNMFWEQGIHKKSGFSIHFDVDSNEFNQLFQTSQINLSGKLFLPLAHPNEPLQSHHSIMEIHEPHIHPANVGYNNNPTNPLFSSNAKWPTSPRDPHVQNHVVPFVTYVASVSHSSPKEIKAPSQEFHIDKGKKLVVIPSTDTYQSTSIHSKLKSTKADSGRREISFSGMHRELSNYEVKGDKKPSFKDRQHWLSKHP